MIKVYFPGKNLRQRRRETVTHPPVGVEYITEMPLEAMPADHVISKGGGKKQVSFKHGLLEKIVSFLSVPNIKWINKKFLQGVSLAHTPGFIPLNRIKFVIEVDNPLCLARYNMKTFLKRKSLIERLLLSKNCVSIICISEAAKKSMSYYFSEEVIKKCIVVYPFVEENSFKKESGLEKTIILTCNTKFYMKGTRDILLAYERLRQRYRNLELWVVSNTPNEYIEKYKDFSDVKFFKAEYSKADLYKMFYSQCDIFVQASLQDSFGLVYLELLASGKPTVTTDIYAIPEVVRDGYNGFLIEAPFYMYNSDYSLKDEYFPMNCEDTEEDFYKKVDGEQMVEDIYQKLDALLADSELCKQMSKNALSLLREKFSETNRKCSLSFAYGIKNV